MSVLRVMGTETEYGISVPGQPGANAMVTSSQIVNAYQAATAARARRARWDFEEENPLRDARGFDLTREAADSSQNQQGKGHGDLNDRLSSQPSPRRPATRSRPASDAGPARCGDQGQRPRTPPAQAAARRAPHQAAART